MAKSENPGVERELKFHLQSAAARDKLLSVLSKPERTISQENYFFDTSEYHLLRAGWALRVRIEKTDSIESAELTAKGLTEQEGALSQRPEINQTIDRSMAGGFLNGSTDLTELKNQPIETIRPLIGTEKLIPLISFTNTRVVSLLKAQSFPLKMEIDTIKFSDNSEDYELEVELSPDQLESLEEAISVIKQAFKGSNLELLPETKSKFQRALERTGLAEEFMRINRP